MTKIGICQYCDKEISLVYYVYSSSAQYPICQGCYYKYKDEKCLKLQLVKNYSIYKKYTCNEIYSCKCGHTWNTLVSSKEICTDLPKCPGCKSSTNISLRDVYITENK